MTPFYKPINSILVYSGNDVVQFREIFKVFAK